MHPTVICNAYSRALEAALDVCEGLAVVVDPENREQMRDLVRSSIGTKFVSRYGDLMADLAIDAVLIVRQEEGGRTEIDLKRFARVERIPGGEMSDCRVLDGVMVNKDVTNARMRRKIENPRVVLLDCPLEYKKMESGAQLELTKEEDFEAILKMEEDFIQKACADIIALKPDVIFTEKGIADLAQHYFVKHGISAIRRIRKTDNDRIARATGATIVHRTDELTEDDIGTQCGLFEIRKLGDEYFTFLEKCKEPKACTIMLRGGSKDVLNELERNLQDAMQVARNIIIEPKLLPGGGATEMAVSVALAERARAIKGVEQWPFKAVGVALEIIPRTLAQNCGADVVRLMTELRAAKAGNGAAMLGVDGNRGVLADMSDLGVWDAFSVKTQTLKTAVEQATMLLRIDDIVSGGKKKAPPAMAPPEE